MRRHATDIAVLVLGVAIYAGLAVTSLRQKSATYDEASHLPAGYSYWAFGDFRLNPEHPPLVKLIAASPLLLMDVRVEEQSQGWRLRRQWEFGRRFLYHWNDADRLLFWARLTSVALGAALAVSVFLWARQRFGRKVAWLALFLCVLCPEVLAHGRLVTTDLAAALAIFLSVVGFGALADRVTWRRLLLAGLAVGAAAATKFSALVLAPILVTLAAVVALSREPLALELRGLRSRTLASRGAKLLATGFSLVAIAVVALTVLWASYGFRSRFSPDPVVNQAFDWDRVRAEGAVGGAAREARHFGLLPDPYVYGLLRVFKHSERRPAFLMGEISEGGWWYYFLVSFAIKNTLPLLILLALGIASPLRRSGRWRDEAFLWLPVLIYGLLTLTRGINIGNRHLLPIYPFVFVIAARGGVWLLERRLRAVPLVLAILLGWYAAATARIHPHYLAYFNELAGGPRNGYHWLVDSNLDWGQDLKGLAAHVAERGIPRIRLSYFGTADPNYYGIPHDLLPGKVAPPPAGFVRQVRRGDLVAVSATNLQGVYLDPQDRPLMERLRASEPIDSIGYSILIYRADFAWP